MTLSMYLDTDPPLTDKERHYWIEFLRGIADCLERGDDTRLSPERQALRICFTGGGADAWRQRLRGT